MKKILIAAILCVCTAIAWGQGLETKVSLDISPLVADSIWIQVEDGSSPTQILTADANGLFVFSVLLEQAKDVKFGMDKPVKGSLNLYLEPGDDLTIKTDFKDNTVFSGKGADNAKVLNGLMNLYITNYQKLDATKVSKEILFGQIKQMNKENMDFLEANKSRVSPSFYTHTYTKFYYDALGMDIIYPYIYSQGFGKKFTEVLPQGYMDLIEKVELSDDLLDHPTYNRFIKGSLTAFLRYRHLNELGRLDSAIKQTEDEKRKMEYDLAKQHLKGKIRSLAMFSTVNSLLLGAKDVKEYQPYIAQFVADGGSKEEAIALKAVYDRALQLAKGNVPPPFELNDLNGNKVSLKDFAGKVVYIDFWASWCAPCRYEMKNGSPKLHARFADEKDLVFLYISIDDNEAQWRKAIVDDKIEGIHLLSKGGTKSVVSKAFNISGIPRYVIIGRDGTIVDNDASRPSDEKTYNKLMEALAGS